MVVEGFLQHIDHLAGLQGDSNFCSQNFPTGPINNGYKVNKPLGHLDTGRVQRPDLVGLMIGTFANYSDSTISQLPFPIRNLIGCTSNYCASSVNVLAPAIADNATLALKLAACFRLVPLPFSAL